MDTEAIAAFDLLSRMRFACGDNGKRMQDELEEYLRELKRDADRYRWLRKRSPYQSSPGGYVAWAQFSNGRYCGTTHPNHDELDAEIDAAMNGANA